MLAKAQCFVHQERETSKMICVNTLLLADPYAAWVISLLGETNQKSVIRHRQYKYTVSLHSDLSQNHVTITFQNVLLIQSAAMAVPTHDSHVLLTSVPPENSIREQNTISSEYYITQIYELQNEESYGSTRNKRFMMMSLLYGTRSRNA